MDEATCGSCHRWATEDTPLSLCSGCKLIYYCSKDCQRKAWKSHKPVCQKDEAPKSPFDYTQKEYVDLVHQVSPAYLALGNDTSLNYFTNVAPLKSEVQELAERIKFPIPGVMRGLT